MEELIQFLFEVGHLKNVDRSGWWLLGNRAPESVAEHSFRCAIVGYILAKLENVDVSKVIIMCLFHDVHEARTNDLHKIAQGYLKHDEAEATVSNEQFGPLKAHIGEEIESVINELVNQESEESIVAKDADILECAMQAREYQLQGYDAAIDWVDRAKERLRTGASKKMLAIVEHSDPNEWWKKLKEQQT
ncbi:MAG: HD domain-containing protein [Candidatus Scalindua sp. AMX11]|nr:MAG: HD domain-containing protein [Candidatus Scalindua sp.]NOG83416.1 HD domain-containing protein [Planctomycetota bacterium]RZV75071.1 MAG: HD domain-containing protein [Candidatus Scalindua sp. SCAELEC01]TDE64332.1 MAG: HD domain-containing protein [Candidatus Scalindua sp. AMX11]GJQ60608.1 MAG: haloacid dehalogenase [Candidatus Scalindua sp.]